MAPLPSWKQLMVNNKKTIRVLDTIWGKSEECYFFSRGCYALRCILQFYKDCYPEKEVCIYLPSYFCNETIEGLDAEGVIIIYYPINEYLEPEYKICKNMAKEFKPDLFLLVHFFGHPSDTSEASVFCRNIGAELIEDAAHVLYPTRGIGVKASFTLYSPHKLLPIPDGSVLVIKEKNFVSQHLKLQLERFEKVKKGLEKPYNHTYLLNWKIKKVVQKLLCTELIHCIRKICPEKKDFSCRKALKIKSLNIPTITGYSHYILTEYYTKELIIKIGETRKYKYRLWEFLIKESMGYKALFEYNSSQEWIPYVAAIRCVYKSNKDKLLKKCNENYHICDTWPDLPPDITADKENYANYLEESVMICSLHDSIMERKIIDIFRKHMLFGGNNKFKITKKSIDSEKKQDININLMQSDVYTSAKQDLHKWKRECYEISREEDLIGYFYCLIKNRGIKICRINRGPVIYDSVNLSDEDWYNILLCIKKEFSLRNGKILSYAPVLEMSGSSIALMMMHKFKYRNEYWSSGYIDLKLSEEDLRKQLTSKWRNLLKKSENYKCQIIIDDNNVYLEKLLELHSYDKEIRNYHDSGEEITNYLGEKNKLISYIAKLDEEILSFIIVVYHNVSSTYLIGWNSTEGYQHNLNRRLLWNAMTDMRTRGVKRFDLGGIDKVNTTSIADFKMGTRCKYYELVGEYISF